MADAFPSAEKDINAGKMELLQAVAQAGTQGRQAYEATQKSMQQAQAQAAQDALNRASVVNAPAAFTQQLQAQQAVPFDRRAADIAQIKGANEMYRDSAAASGQRYMAGVSAAVPIARAQAERAYAQRAAETQAKAKAEKEISNSNLETIIKGATRMRLAEQSASDQAVVGPAEAALRKAESEFKKAQTKAKTAKKPGLSGGTLVKSSESRFTPGRIAATSFLPVAKLLGKKTVFDKPKGHLDGQKVDPKALANYKKSQADVGVKAKQLEAAKTLYDRAQSQTRGGAGFSETARAIAKERGVATDRAFGLFSAEDDLKEEYAGVPASVKAVSNATGLKPALVRQVQTSKPYTQAVADAEALIASGATLAELNQAWSVKYKKRPALVKVLQHQYRGSDKYAFTPQKQASQQRALTFLEDSE